MIVGLHGDLDAYGDEVKETLRRVNVRARSAAHEFAIEILQSFKESEERGEILRRFAPDEFERVTREVSSYAARLFAPELTRERHQEIAEKAGRVNAMIGVDVLWLLEAFGLFEQHLVRALLPVTSNAGDDYLLRGCIGRRIHLEIEGQVKGYRQIRSMIASARDELDAQVLIANNIADLHRRTLAILAGLPGGVDAFFARVQGESVLQIEASAGRWMDQYQSALQSGAIPQISVDSPGPTGQGPCGRAWRTRKIVVSEAWAIDDQLDPWKPVGMALGFRSNVALPVLDRAGNPIALLVMYSQLPGYFSTPGIEGLLRHLQHLLEHALEQFKRPKVVPYHDQETYRRLLRERRVTLLYQPIIDLRTGRLVRLEGLARLREKDGALIVPGDFLPAFGESELLQLFRCVLVQACEYSRWLEERDFPAYLSINLPADALARSEYEDALLKTTSRHQLPADRITLEILETEEMSLHFEEWIAAIDRLRGHGFQLVQDDLGSGYSSLLRMDAIPFDEVKIDQGLVRRISENPKRALGFILNLTRLAHACHTRVTVEGLEKLGLTEAAAVLGADFGQGYGISPPLAGQEIPRWFQEYRHVVNVEDPVTETGRMALDLLREHRVLDHSLTVS